MYYTILSNEKIAKDVFKTVLRGDVSKIVKPGMFVNIALEGLYLRRPISVSEVCGDTFTIIYKVVGEGTMRMSKLVAGTELDILTGLGNGYDLDKCGKSVLVVGGGAGVPPMYGLAKDLIENGKKVSAVLGFNSSCDVFYENEFNMLGVKTAVTTADGTYGIKGFVTDALPLFDYDYICACGPEPMLKALMKATDCGAQISLESRMGCGFGVCMCCSIKTKSGAKRVCTDGCVFERSDIIWE